MKGEIAALVEDLAEWVEAYGADGVRSFPRDGALPPAEHLAVESAATPAPRAESAWTALAAPVAAAPEVGASGLRAIREDLGDCRRCGLCAGRKQIVFGVGDADADLVIIGEGPGYNEDQQGEPFVGEAGQMLNRMLLNVLSLRREDVHILNVVKCRPPNNRDPQPDEVAACLPFLERQIAAIRPKVILVLGRIAMNSLWGSEDSIKRRRGSWTDYRGIPAMITFHPAYLLRQPDDKRLVFEDLKALLQRYDELGGKRSGKMF